MRKHVVNCQIEGNVEEIKEVLTQRTNEFYVEIVEKMLEQSGWEKEEQLRFLDKLIDYMKSLKNNDL